MDKNTVIIRFNNYTAMRGVDLDIPLDISANELVVALNSAYDLGIDVSNVKKCFLRSENPIALLRGNKTLEEYGIRNGSVIFYKEEKS